MESEYREQMRKMLFSLKGIVKDTDNEAIKQKIDNEIIDIEANESHNVDENASFIRDTIENVEVSFKKRKKQMLTDCQIVKKIDDSLDLFRELEDKKVQNLVGTLIDEVNKELDNYCKEIVSALNPYEIKERFESKDKFEQWLKLRNENYKNLLNKSIERRVQGVMRKYLQDVDILFETLGKYINERESYIEVEDEFYGSLAISKKSTLEQTKQTVSELTVYNKTLYEASEELFAKVYRERKKLDNAKMAASISGGAVGALATYGAVAAQVIPGGIVGYAAGAIAIYSLQKTTKSIAEKIYGANMEKNVKVYVDEFNQEVKKTKDEMQVLLTQNTLGMFEEEQQKIEKSFLELRKVTYIDEKNIPSIEEKVESLKEEIKKYA